MHCFAICVVCLLIETVYLKKKQAPIGSLKVISIWTNIFSHKSSKLNVIVQTYTGEKYDEFNSAVWGYKDLYQFYPGLVMINSIFIKDARIANVL